MVAIKRIGVLQMAKVLGLLYLLASAIFLIPGGLFVMIVSSLKGSPHFGTSITEGVLLFFLPLLYGLGGFIGGAIVAAVYNLVASIAGGIEIEFEQ